MSLTQRVIDANIELHSKLAPHYRECEPHFRAENVAKVRARLTALVSEAGADSVLDLGCGTGFVIDIVKHHVRRVVGVDVTPAMLERVDRSGPAAIELVTSDTGTYLPEPGSFQLVTAYSFLHHLADVGPTFETASRALAPGGMFYADLEPNFYFWEGIRALDPGLDCHSLVRREIEAVTARDVEAEATFGVSREAFRHAEFGKDVAGGFKEELLEEQLRAAGLSAVSFHYHWFLGEAFLINSGAAPRDELLHQASVVHHALQRALPVSRSLFKYLGFVATK
jgi:SAM-dependent methyltransferase